MPTNWPKMARLSVYLVLIGAIWLWGYKVGKTGYYDRSKMSHKVVIHGEPIAGKYYRLDDPDDIIAYKTVKRYMKAAGCAAVRG